jgi:two-component system OmpR family response regulator
MNTATRIFVVEDMSSMRERLIEFLTDIAGVDVVGAAGRPAEAIHSIVETQPDLVLLDYQLDGGTGLDVMRAIRPRAPDVVFAILTSHATPQHRRACLEAGAATFFDKATDCAQMRTFIVNFRQLRQSTFRPSKGRTT